MKRLLTAGASLLIALALPSCLQSETTIRLNKDGSGTLVEQTTLGGQMMAMLEQFSALGAEKGKDPVSDMFSDDKAKAKAAKMGPGVTFEKSEPVTAGDNKGARVTYRFADINTLRISPGDGMKDLSPMAGQAPPTPNQKPVVFGYKDGTLVVTMPEAEKPVLPADAPKPEMPDLAGNPEMEAMMKQMLGDMKVSLKVVIEPGIAETDATHREGNTVTLMQMEMGKLLENPDTLKKLAGADQSNPAAALEIFKGLEGVKMEVKKQITVKVN